MAAPSVFNVLFLGATGHGKSSLVDALLDSETEEEDRPKILVMDVDDAKRNGAGTTKVIEGYRGKVISENRKLRLWDSPGVGDEDVTAAKLVAMLEGELHAPRPEFDLGKPRLVVGPRV